MSKFEGGQEVLVAGQIAAGDPFVGDGLIAVKFGTSPWSSLRLPESAIQTKPVQPAFAPGECWVRAKLVHAQAAYEHGKAVVQVDNCRLALAKADVLQGNPPVLGTTVDAALAMGRQKLYDLLGVTSQDAALAKIAELKKLASTSRYAPSTPVHGIGQPTAPASPGNGPTAAEAGTAANAGGTQAQTPPAATTARPLTADQLAKVQVGDHVLVRMPVVKNTNNMLLVKNSSDKEGWAIDVGVVVGHEPAPPKPVESGCKAKHFSFGDVQVLHVDGNEAWVKDANGVRRAATMQNLTRLPDA